MPNEKAPGSPGLLCSNVITSLADRDGFEGYDGRTILATPQYRCPIAVTFLQLPLPRSALLRDAIVSCREARLTAPSPSGTSKPESRMPPLRLLPKIGRLLEFRTGDQFIAALCGSVVWVSPHGQPRTNWTAPNLSKKMGAKRDSAEDQTSANSRCPTTKELPIFMQAEWW